MPGVASHSMTLSGKITHQMFRFFLAVERWKSALPPLGIPYAMISASRQRNWCQIPSICRSILGHRGILLGLQGSPFWEFTVLQSRTRPTDRRAAAGGCRGSRRSNPAKQPDDTRPSRSAPQPRERLPRNTRSPTPGQRWHPAPRGGLRERGETGQPSEPRISLGCNDAAQT